MQKSSWVCRCAHHLRPPQGGGRESRAGLSNWNFRARGLVGWGYQSCQCKPLPCVAPDRTTRPPLSPPGQLRLHCWHQEAHSKPALKTVSQVPVRGWYAILFFANAISLPPTHKSLTGAPPMTFHVLPGKITRPTLTVPH